MDQVCRIKVDQDPATSSAGVLGDIFSVVVFD